MIWAVVQAAQLHQDVHAAHHDCVPLITLCSDMVYFIMVKAFSSCVHPPPSPIPATFFHLFMFLTTCILKKGRHLINSYITRDGSQQLSASVKQWKKGLVLRLVLWIQFSEKIINIKLFHWWEWIHQRSQ